MTIEVRQATVHDAGIVGTMAVALTEEISAELGAAHFDLDTQATIGLCRELLQEGRYAAFIAFAGPEAVGFVGLSEGRALYANGMLITMQEFFVAPAWRSQAVGAALIGAAMRHARASGCKRVEVCTPPLPQFARSLAFYERHGFEVTGGRKLRRLV